MVHLFVMSKSHRRISVNMSWCISANGSETNFAKKNKRRGFCRERDSLLVQWGYMNVCNHRYINPNYRKASNISRTSVGDEIVDNSDVVEASPVGAAPTTSLFST